MHKARKAIRIKAFPPLKFRVTPYSILVEDLDSTIRRVCNDLLPVMAVAQREALIDKLYEEITLILTEDIDFES